jgi:hypothetical protein
MHYFDHRYIYTDRRQQRQRKPRCTWLMNALEEVILSYDHDIERYRRHRTRRYHKRQSRARSSARPRMLGWALFMCMFNH